MTHAEETEYFGKMVSLRRPCTPDQLHRVHTVFICLHGQDELDLFNIALERHAQHLADTRRSFPVVLTDSFEKLCRTKRILVLTNLGIVLDMSRSLEPEVVVVRIHAKDGSPLSQHGLGLIRDCFLKLDTRGDMRFSYDCSDPVGCQPADTTFRNTVYKEMANRLMIGH